MNADRSLSMLIKSVQMSIGVLTDPAATFDRLKTEKHNAIVPFALVFASIVTMFLYYFANVDFAWLKSSMLDQMAVAIKSFSLMNTLN